MSMFDLQIWATLPTAFWSVVFFAFGSIVGSFLNVCIYRLPRGESIVSPPSHCPQCKYHIPGYLNVPIFTWIILRGRCANCGQGISIRYLIVEFLTGCAFLTCWLGFGHVSAGLALVYCLLAAGFLVATFIDFEHFIIPDEITLGGMGVGFLASFAVPVMHGTSNPVKALQASFLGILVGAGLMYGILRLAKVLFGRQTHTLPPDSKVVFTEDALELPGEVIPYEEIFYRKSDTITLIAKTVQLGERTFENVPVRLNLLQHFLQIGEESFDPETVTHMEVVTDQIIRPREAMGLGDVKFMGAIGAFLGWKSVLFSLMVSSIIGSLVGVMLILLRKKEWSSRIPYGPYIALAAMIWIFYGKKLAAYWLPW